MKNFNHSFKNLMSIMTQFHLSNIKILHTLAQAEIWENTKTTSSCYKLVHIRLTVCQAVLPSAFSTHS